MAQYDGSVVIEAKVEAKDAKKQLISLQNSMVKTAKTIDSLRSKMDALEKTKTPTQEYKKLQSQLDATIKKYEELDDQVKTFQKIGTDTKSEPFRKAQDEAQELYMKIEDIRGAMFELEENGKAFTLGTDTEQYAQMQQRMEQYQQEQKDNLEQQHRTQAALAEYEQKLADIKTNAVVVDERTVELMERKRQLLAEIEQLESVGVTQGYADYEDRQAEIASINQEIAARREEKQAADETTSSLERMKNMIVSSFVNFPKNVTQLALMGIQKAAQGAVSVLGKLKNTVKNGLTSAFKKLGGIAKGALSKITSMFISSGKASGNFSTGLKGGLKTILKYGLGIRSLYVLVNKLRTAIKEGFTNLYNANVNGFKSQVDSLRASLLTLKNAFAAAFSPIVQAAIPYLRQLISWLTAATNAFGQFIAALTGQKIYTKAVKQTAAALEDEAGAAKDANKQLSGLDKLNNLTSNDSSGGGSSTDTSDMFEEVPISDKWKNIADWLKQMWEDSDFYELGQLLGEKLKAALGSIPWDKIRETARKIGKGLATLINGSIEVDGLGYSIGNTLARAINAGFEFLNSFVHELHWESIGHFIADTLNGIFQNIDWELIRDTLVTRAKGIGDAINSFVTDFDWEAFSNNISSFFNSIVDTIYTFITTTDWETLGENVGKTISGAFMGIDWAKAGETVGEAFKAFFDFISSTIENVDWKAVGENVKEFIVNIDWAGVADSFFETVGSVFGGFAAFLWGLIEDAWNDVVDWWHDTAYEDGEFTMSGLLEGIWEKIKDIGAWIKEHIFEPFIDGFKKAFGISSPSTVMQEMGTYIIQGLLNGITFLVDKVKEIWNGMKETATQIFTAVGELLATIWDSIKTNAESVWNGLKTMITTVWNGIKSVTAAVWDGIKSSVSTAISAIKGTVSSALSEIKSTWSSIWNSFTGIVSGVMSSVKSTVSSALDWISDKIQAVKNAFNSIKNAVSGYSGSSSGSPYSLHSTPATAALASLASVSIPRLAQGTVVPTGMKEYLAVFGDNNRETEVVSPLSTIEQALDNKLKQYGFGTAADEKLELHVYLDGREISSSVKKYARDHLRRTGRPMFAQ